MASSSRRPPEVEPMPRSSVPKKRWKDKGKGKAKEQGVAPQKPGDDCQSISAWPWVSLTDSVVGNHPPIFTKDGSYFFSIAGPSIKIYSATTGQVVLTLSGEHPHRKTPHLAQYLAGPDVITSAILSPHNSFQLITGSLNGCIMVWDFLDASLLQIVDIAQPVTHLCAHKNLKDAVIVGVTRPSKEKSASGWDDFGIALQVSLKPDAATVSSQVQKSSLITSIGRTRSMTGLDISASGSWLVAIAGHKAYVASMSTLKSGFTKYVSPERLTCLKCHPLDDYFATGDDQGVVRIWYCLDGLNTVKAKGVEKKSQTTILHWHAHAVSSLTFTPNGAYLLSGGEESVLVIWQLHTGNKEFVPRVSAPIKALAVSNAGNGEEEYLLSLADATYTFVNAGTLKISRSFARIKLDSYTFTSPFPVAPLAVHPLSSTLILPSSHPSSLQIYSPSSSKLVSELEVSASNRVSRRDEKPVEPSRVETVAVSSSGEWMATIDGRHGDEYFRGEVYLKIWLWDPKSGFWILNTRIDRPHALMKVNTVTFSPVKDRRLLQLVTSGQDGNVKTWRIRSKNPKDGQSEEVWMARSSFSFRAEIATHVSWSPDGSLLAVSFGPYVVLYDPITNVQRHLWTSSDYRRIPSAHFLGRTGRYLAIVGFTHVVLWDVVTQSTRWQFECPHHPIFCIKTHPSDETFAIFHFPAPAAILNTRIAVLHTSSPTPQAIRVVPFGLLNVSWYKVSSSKSSSFSFVGITTTGGVVAFGDDVDMPQDDGGTAKGVFGETQERRTLFQDIFGKSAFADLSNAPAAVTPMAATSAPSQTAKKVATIFDGPAYLMPPLETLFTPLMDSFLKACPKDSTTMDDGEGKDLNPTEASPGSDDDVDMDNNGPIIAGKQTSLRAFTNSEIDHFIHLFKAHAINAKPSHNGPLPNGPKVIMPINGTSKVNGHSHYPMPNGTNPLRQSLQIPATSPISSPLPSTPAPSGHTNRKRKKSFI